MISLWARFRDELEHIEQECHWCGDTAPIVYTCEAIPDQVCQHCLMNIEYEDPERGLNGKERNE